MNFDRWISRALTRVSLPERECFVLNPLRTLSEDARFTVRAVEHLSENRGQGGACDGISFLDDGVILYAPSPHSKRQNFTLAHEFGHWLVEQDANAMVWIADTDNPSMVLESLCDAIAQRLLLPDDLIDHVVETPIRARNVVALFEQSSASLPVCAIAVASRLPGLGAVVLIDRPSMRVTSASIHPHPEHGWPAIYPWPGEAIPPEHSLSDLAAGGVTTRRSFWRNRWGVRTDYYIDAIASERQICVLLADTDLWGVEPMPLPVLDDRAYRTRPTNSFQCCGERRAVRGFPCPKCGRGFCPQCGNCRCTTVSSSETHCKGCNSIAPAHLMVDGLCELCA